MCPLPERRTNIHKVYLDTNFDNVYHRGNSHKFKMHLSGHTQQKLDKISLFTKNNVLSK